MILITTSHRPTRLVRTLCKDLAYTIPSLKKVNRGKMSLYEVGEKAIDMGADKALIIDRWKGRPGRIRFFEVKEGISQISPQLYIRGVKLRRDFKTERAPFQCLFIENPNSNENSVQRLSETFSEFFGLPIIRPEKMEGQENFVTMRLSLEPKDMIRISFYLMPGNLEVGPRLRISHVVWEI